MRRAWSLALALALVPPPLAAWSARGHRLVTASAAAAVAERLPGFWLEGVDVLADASVEPDVTRHRSLPQLRARESPEHYFNLELLAGQALPATRGEVETRDQTMSSRQPGYLPYAIVEGTQRLTLAFAELRRSPESSWLAAKALLYGGHLAHYAADLAQPLHTTIHHDGRAREGGASPHSGLHAAMDGLLDAEGLDVEAALRDLVLQPRDDTFATVVAALEESHGRVERVYVLERKLELLEEGGEPTGEVLELSAERLCAAVSLTAELWLTAWRDSERLDLPFWY